MNKIKNNSGFTLLEIIIVIIIVGVLASLALPRLFSTIEFSRSTEAFAAMTTIRSSMERCRLMNNNSFADCGDFANLDIEQPGDVPNAHFTYTYSGMGADAYVVTATRNTRDGGAITSNITIEQTATSVLRGGATAFANVN